MEEVEGANKAAVESCHRVLSLLSQPHEDSQCGKLAAEAGEAVARFKKVVAMLGTGLGPARVRTQRGIPLPIHHKLLLETPVACRIEPPSQPHPISVVGSSVQRFDWNAKIPYQQLPQKLFMDNSMLEMDPHRGGIQLGQMLPSTAQLQFFQPPPPSPQQQQQSNQRLQLQQQMKLQDMFRRSNSSINLKFDNPSLTPTASSTRSFLSSLSSMDGSVGKLDGKAFSLIGAPQTSERMNSHQHHLKRRCTGGEEGSGKCATSGKCHCSEEKEIKAQDVH